MGILKRTIYTTTVIASAVAFSWPAFGAGPVAEKLSDQAASISSRKTTDGRRWIKARVVVHAPKDIVWNSIKDSRNHDPDLLHSRVLQAGETQAIVEEKMRLPLIGSDVYVVKITSKPFERWDYKLLKSHHLKEYEGTWHVSAGDTDGSSVLQLEHHARPNFFVPGPLFDRFVVRRVERQIMNVKRIAETNGQAKAKPSSNK